MNSPLIILLLYVNHNKLAEEFLGKNRKYFISDGWIRDLGFNLRLYQKPISVLVWW